MTLGSMPLSMRSRWMNFGFLPTDSELSDKELLEKMLDMIYRMDFVMTYHPLSGIRPYCYSLEIHGPFTPFDREKDSMNDAYAEIQDWIADLDKNGLPFSRSDIFANRETAN